MRLGGGILLFRHCHHKNATHHFSCFSALPFQLLLKLFAESDRAGIVRSIYTITVI